MAIIHIEGPKKSGKSLMANAMRNTHIGQSQPEEGVIKGALLVDDNQTGEPRYLLEKLMDGDILGERPGVGEAIPRKVSDIKWKADVTVIFVGDKIDLLAEFEELVPGFTKAFGPVTKLATSAS